MTQPIPAFDIPIDFRIPICRVRSVTVVYIASRITSMLIAFPYLRVVVLMWLTEPGESTPTVSIPGALTSAALAIGVLATLALGVIPAPLIDLTNDAAQFVR